MAHRVYILYGAYTAYDQIMQTRNY